MKKADFFNKSSITINSIIRYTHNNHTYHVVDYYVSGSGNKTAPISKKTADELSAQWQIKIQNQ